MEIELKRKSQEVEDYRHFIDKQQKAAIDNQVLLSNLNKCNKNIIGQHASVWYHFYVGMAWKQNGN